MKAEELITALAELERQGWSVQTWGPRNGEYGVQFIYPDGSYDQCADLYADGFQFQRDVAKLQGFLVAELEARGYRRDVKWGYDLKPWVQVCSVDGHALDWGGDGDTELEATLNACLALAPGSAAPEET